MIFKLALQDLWHDRLMSLCVTSAMVAVLAPLLLLFSLRYGILHTLDSNLRDNPLNLELRMMQGYNLDEDFFTSLRHDPHVGFVVEMTRALSVTADIGFNGKARTMIETIPTAEGDPIARLSGVAKSPADDEILLTASLARELGAGVGDTVRVVINRIKDGNRENGSEKFRILGIIDELYNSRNCIYLNLNAVAAMEDFRDGFNPAIFSDGSNPNSQRTHFAKARLYAKSIDDVDPLSVRLRASYNISDSLMAIENVRSIGRVLSFVFYTIAVTSVIGGIIASGGLLVSNLGRKEGSFAMLQLMGCRRSDVTRLVVYEALLLSALAYVCALGLFYGGQSVFNLYFSNLLKGQAVVSTLTGEHVAVAFLITAATSLCISLVCAKFRLSGVTVATAMREIR